jgi:hypothetical protein
MQVLSCRIRAARRSGLRPTLPATGSLARPPAITCRSCLGCASDAPALPSDTRVSAGTAITRLSDLPAAGQTRAAVYGLFGRAIFAQMTAMKISALADGERASQHAHDRPENFCAALQFPRCEKGGIHENRAALNHLCHRSGGN